jgi:hypothetical protein
VVDPRKKSEYRHPLDDSFCNEVATAVAAKTVDEVMRTVQRGDPPVRIYDMMFSPVI